MELSIAKEKYEYSDRVTVRLDYNKWVEFVEKNRNYFIWYEDTPDGIQLKENLDKVPEWAREGIMNSHKGKALAEFNTKKGWYEIVVAFYKETGVIKITFMKKVTKDHLKKLLEMAKHLDALLLKDGTEIIDEKAIESLT